MVLLFPEYDPADIGIPGMCPVTYRIGSDHKRIQQFIQAVLPADDLFTGNPVQQ